MSTRGPRRPSPQPEPTPKSHFAPKPSPQPALTVPPRHTHRWHRDRTTYRLSLTFKAAPGADDATARTVVEGITLVGCHSAPREVVGERRPGRRRNLSPLVVGTSNRGPDEWLATFADPMRAQSAVDRFTSNAYDLVVDGESYRARLKPKIPATPTKEAP